jgi:hypothetical protein
MRILVANWDPGAPPPPILPRYVKCRPSVGGNRKHLNSRPRPLPGCGAGRN